jgi:hypothetical protein
LYVHTQRQAQVSVVLALEKAEEQVDKIAQVNFDANIFFWNNKVDEAH